jgi:hypothetical protein
MLRWESLLRKFLLTGVQLDIVLGRAALLRRRSGYFHKNPGRPAGLISAANGVKSAAWPGRGFAAPAATFCFLILSCFPKPTI